MNHNQHILITCICTYWKKTKFWKNAGNTKKIRNKSSSLHHIHN